MGTFGYRITCTDGYKYVVFINKESKKLACKKFKEFINKDIIVNGVDRLSFDYAGICKEVFNSLHLKYK